MSGTEVKRKKAKILLIEDEAKLAKTLADYLTLDGYVVYDSVTGYGGLELFYDKMHELDLVLLDMMLPDIGGMEILKDIRMKSSIPVIVLTARDSVRDQLQTFQYGADDYITKPYVLSLVKVHIEAVLKRAGKLQQEISVGELELVPEGRRAYLKGGQMSLTPREYEVLEFLIRNRGKIQRREMLLEALWGFDYMGDTRTVDTIIKQLRKKLGEYGRCIKSVYGVGYLFEEEFHEE